MLFFYIFYISQFKQTARSYSLRLVLSFSTHTRFLLVFDVHVHVHVRSRELSRIVHNEEGTSRINERGEQGEQGLDFDR